MADQVSGVKMVPVDSKLFESVGYVTGGRLLYIKFRNRPGLCFNGVPSFRFEGLLGAPRKDATIKRSSRTNTSRKKSPSPRPRRENGRNDPD